MKINVLLLLFFRASCCSIAAATAACTSSLSCSSDQVCVDGSCIESDGFKAFNAIARFITENPALTYDATASTTYADLFQCTAGDPIDQLREQQHFMWKGFVDYAIVQFNQIEIDDDVNGGLKIIVDQWGDRCETNAECSLPVARYSECPTTCVPRVFKYPLNNGAEVDIDIYEPCNFVSNLAYHRVMPQLCGGHFYMDSSTASALIHGFGALGTGSAIWHGSHTYLGYQADNQMIGVVSFVLHQIIIEGLDAANGQSVSPTALTQLMDLQASPRSRTAVQISNDVTDLITTQEETQWANAFDNLDIPDYYTTFMVIIASILSVLFPDKDDTIEGLLDGLTGAFGADPAELGLYLPTLQTLAEGLSLTDDQKFALFRQLLGVALKMVLAFLWQEQVLDVPLFREERTNEVAPAILPPLVSLFNFVSGLDHVDQDFQELKDVFPGDEACRASVPHAKWHEISALGLLDMAYLADCTAAVVTGNDAAGCAHLASLNGKGEITEAEIMDWAASAFPSSVPIFKDIIPVFITEVFLLFDVTRDDKIDWADVTALFDIAENVADCVGSIVARIEDFIAKFENYCYQDSQCDGVDEFCNFLVFGCRPKRDNGFFGCIKDSQCYSDRCVDTTRVCEAKLEIGDTCTANKACLSDECGKTIAGVGVCGTTCSSDSNCGSNEWCNPNYSPDICRPKRPNGYFPCYEDDQCLSGRCVDTTRVCQAKKSKGQSCLANKECSSNKCRWFRCR